MLCTPYSQRCYMLIEFNPDLNFKLNPGAE